jgi:hypothetical protein
MYDPAMRTGATLLETRSPRYGVYTPSPTPDIKLRRTWEHKGFPARRNPLRADSTVQSISVTHFRKYCQGSDGQGNGLKSFQAHSGNRARDKKASCRNRIEAEKI